MKAATHTNERMNKYATHFWDTTPRGLWYIYS